jgi:phosphoribosylanthranilate isomerase
MKDPENIRELITLNPDYIGFILYPGSKRYLGDHYQLNMDIPANIKRVGVFVNELIDRVLFWINRLGLNYVQLHGDEAPEYCRELYSMKISVIKAFGIGQDFDFSILKAYEPYCGHFLFDTKTLQRGGSGESFDWDLLKAYNYSTPLILSGGIGPEDATAIRDISGLPLHAVDVNSRFELSPGIKNMELLEKFFNELRN